MGGESEDSCVAMPRGVVVARDLHKRYGDSDVVGGISFCVEEGECFGLLGPNGAGKTTTISMILGHCRISSGELEVFGLPIASNALRIREDCGVVSQTDDLDPDFTVEENLQAAAGSPSARRRGAQSVPEALELWGLTGISSRTASVLSGGERRRVEVARALLVRPTVLLLDEPFAGLDPGGRAALKKGLAGLPSGVTMLVTDHSADDVLELADRVLLLVDGRVQYDGPRSNFVPGLPSYQRYFKGGRPGQAGDAAITPEQSDF